MSAADGELEQPRPARGAGFSDAITVSFGDAAAGVYGVARVGLSGAEGERTASGLAMLFADGAPVAVSAEGGIAPSGDEWAGVRAAGVAHEVTEPLRAWRASFADETGRHGFSLELSATSDAGHLRAGDPAAALGGMEGYEQLVEVHGEATIGGKTRRIAGLGQRGHSWGAPDWKRISLARTVGVWLADGHGVTLSAVRAEGIAGHGDEALGAFLMDGVEARSVADARLSTTYDGQGRQRHAGLELYVEQDDGVAHRAAGEVVCGTTLDLGRLRLDSAFMRWRMDGRDGVGRYDVLRRVR